MIVAQSIDRTEVRVCGCKIGTILLLKSEIVDNITFLGPLMPFL